jgi:protein TonB
MRKLVLLLIIQYSSSTFGQIADDNSAIESNVFEQHLISENCHNSINWKSNERCIEKEINGFIQQEFDFDKTINFEPGEYIVHTKFLIDQKGNISDIKIKAPNPTLKNEFDRILELFPNTFRLVNENSEPIIGVYEFPTKIKIME